MKTISYVAGFLLYITSLNVSAIPITTIGGVDNMVTWDELIPGSDLAEAKIFADYLLVDVSTLTRSKVASSSGMSWMEVDGNTLRKDWWAFPTSRFWKLWNILKLKTRLNGRLKAF